MISDVLSQVEVFIVVNPQSQLKEEKLDTVLVRLNPTTTSVLREKLNKVTIKKRTRSPPTSTISSDFRNTRSNKRKREELVREIQIKRTLSATKYRNLLQNIPSFCKYVGYNSSEHADRVLSQPDFTDQEDITILLLNIDKTFYSAASVLIRPNKIKIIGLCGNSRDGKSTKGAGSLMIDFLVDMCRLLSKDKIYLWSTPDAFDFYIKRGFEHVGDLDMVLKVKNYNNYIQGGQCLT